MQMYFPMNTRSVTINMSEPSRDLLLTRNTTNVWNKKVIKLEKTTEANASFSYLD